MSDEEYNVMLESYKTFFRLCFPDQNNAMYLYVAYRLALCSGILSLRTLHLDVLKYTLSVQPFVIVKHLQRFAFPDKSMVHIVEFLRRAVGFECETYEVFGDVEILYQNCFLFVLLAPPLNQIQETSDQLLNRFLQDVCSFVYSYFTIDQNEYSEYDRSQIFTAPHHDKVAFLTSDDIDDFAAPEDAEEEDDDAEEEDVDEYVDDDEKSSRRPRRKYEFTRNVDQALLEDRTVTHINVDQLKSFTQFRKRLKLLNLSGSRPISNLGLFVMTKLQENMLHDSPDSVSLLMSCCFGADKMVVEIFRLWNKHYFCDTTTSFFNGYSWETGELKKYINSQSVKFHIGINIPDKLLDLGNLSISMRTPIPTAHFIIPEDSGLYKNVILNCYERSTPALIQLSRCKRKVHKVITDSEIESEKQLKIIKKTLACESVFHNIALASVLLYNPITPLVKGEYSGDTTREEQVSDSSSSSSEENEDDDEEEDDVAVVAGTKKRKIRAAMPSPKRKHHSEQSIVIRTLPLTTVPQIPAVFSTISTVRRVPNEHVLTPIMYNHLITGMKLMNDGNTLAHLICKVAPKLTRGLLYATEIFGNDAMQATVLFKNFCKNPIFDEFKIETESIENKREDFITSIREASFFCAQAESAGDDEEKNDDDDDESSEAAVAAYSKLPEHLQHESPFNSIDLVHIISHFLRQNGTRLDFSDSPPEVIVNIATIVLVFLRHDPNVSLNIPYLEEYLLEHVDREQLMKFYSRQDVLFRDTMDKVNTIAHMTDTRDRSLLTAVQFLLQFASMSLEKFVYLARWIKSIECPGNFVKMFLLMTGSSCSGKSKFIEYMSNMFNCGYANVVSQSLINPSSMSELNSQVLPMKHNLLVNVDEFKNINATTINMLTSSTSQSYRVMHTQNYQMLEMHAKVFLTCNKLPIITDMNKGNETRLQLLSFDHSYRQVVEPGRWNYETVGGAYTHPEYGIQLITAQFPRNISERDIVIGMEDLIEYLFQRLVTGNPHNPIEIVVPREIEENNIRYIQQMNQFERYKKHTKLDLTDPALTAYDIEMDIAEINKNKLNYFNRTAVEEIISIVVK